MKLAQKKIILVSIKNNLKTSDIENLGAEFYRRVDYGKNSEYFLISDSIKNKNKNFLGHFLHGLKLKSYQFNKYKSKKETRKISVNIIGIKNKPSDKTQLKFKALEEGTFYARDLVSEPGNILHPDEYAKRLSKLRNHGLKINNIYDEKKLKKLGMNALLGSWTREYKRIISCYNRMEWGERILNLWRLLERVFVLILEDTHLKPAKIYGRYDL